MKLKSIQYKQFPNKSREWQLSECTFSKINLMVGKNASGKTKTLNIIGNLSTLLAGLSKLHFLSGYYQVHFDNNGVDIKYLLEYENSKVRKEELRVASEVLLYRKTKGKGKLRAIKLNENMDFQTPEDEIAAFVKRDEIQHPFLNDLYSWGNNLLHFYFGSTMGKDFLAVPAMKEEKKEELTLKDTNQVVARFLKGKKRFGNNFLQTIKKDMKAIGYNLNTIEAGTLSDLTFKGQLASAPIGLIVKESDLKSTTDQYGMSQGMFRTLSLIIQINYALMKSKPSCILIDDIGEGLDYERAIKLIKLLIKKAELEDTQLIMSTNDRFVMNTVPLKYWSIIKRIGNKSKILDYSNSKNIFDDFELSGLSNFDLFSSKEFLQRKRKR